MHTIQEAHTEAPPLTDARRLGSRLLFVLNSVRFGSTPFMKAHFEVPVKGSMPGRLHRLR